MDHKTEYERIERNAKIRKTVFRVVVYGLLVFWAFMVLFPFTG